MSTWTIVGVRERARKNEQSKAYPASYRIKGLKRNEVTYLAHLRGEEIEETSGPVAEPVKGLLEEFEDVMPDEEPKRNSYRPSPSCSPARMLFHSLGDKVSFVNRLIRRFKWGSIKLYNYKTRSIEKKYLRLIIT